MQSFFDNLKSPAWWFSVVVVGIVLSWVAAYVKEWTDRLGGTVSRRWGERTAAKAASRKALIKQLRANPHEQVMMGIEALGDMIHGAFYLGLALATLYISVQAHLQWIAWVGLFILASGAFRMGSGALTQLLLRDARRQAMENR